MSIEPDVPGLYSDRIPLGRLTFGNLEASFPPALNVFISSANGCAEKGSTYDGREAISTSRRQRIGLAASGSTDCQIDEASASASDAVTITICSTQYVKEIQGRQTHQLHTRSYAMYQVFAGSTRGIGACFSDLSRCVDLNDGTGF